MFSFVTDDLLRADRNSLTLVRILLAASVIYSHSLEATHATDETIALFGRPISWMAVNGFFALSGFLMYRSLERKPSISSFALARFLRIWPGIAVMTLVVTILFIPFSTVPLPQYLVGTETLRFIFSNLVLINNYTLTGVYCGGAVLCTVNGSLWTIPWEIRCYFGIALLSKLGLLRSRAFYRFVIPLTIVYALLFAYPPVHARLDALLHGHLYYPEQVGRLWTSFMLGALAYAMRHRIPLSWAGALALFGLVFVTRNAMVGDLVRSIAILYWILCLGFHSRVLVKPSAKISDLSFGTYIYSFPVMDVILISFPRVEGHVLGLATFLFVLPVAALSWELVEKPAQALRNNLRLPQFRRFRLG
ncbi:acyltransferase family protein [Sphingomonas sp.]|uniref:acyltransferase family protein n=1 Tax=Sphingomonas sp. TaxID=28214 RepID=UPI002FD93BC7